MNRKVLKFVCEITFDTGFLPRGGGGGGGGGEEGAPLKQFALPSKTFAPPPKIWSENDRKVSITKEICVTLDFAP